VKEERRFLLCAILVVNKIPFLFTIWWQLSIRAETLLIINTKDFFSPIKLRRLSDKELLVSCYKTQRDATHKLDPLQFKAAVVFTCRLHMSNVRMRDEWKFTNKLETVVVRSREFSWTGRGRRRRTSMRIGDPAQMRTERLLNLLKPSGNFTYHQV
jgi:hypothetical protein